MLVLVVFGELGVAALGVFLIVYICVSFERGMFK